MNNIPLSGRQNEVLALVAQGHANKLIARQLSLSQKRVKNELTAVFRNLNVESRTRTTRLTARDDGRRVRQP